jgi:hypothetical protein
MRCTTGPTWSGRGRGSWRTPCRRGDANRRTPLPVEIDVFVGRLPGAVEAFDVFDDGIGGARPDGSGLVGLACGTLVTVAIPLGPQVVL